MHTKKDLIAKYRESLSKFGQKAQRLGEAEMAGRESFQPTSLMQHALWMLDQMESSLEQEDFNPGKFNRWLGWVQCAMAIVRARTIDEAREDVRLLA